MSPCHCSGFEIQSRNLSIAWLLRDGLHSGGARGRTQRRRRPQRHPLWPAAGLTRLASALTKRADSRPVADVQALAATPFLARPQAEILDDVVARIDLVAFHLDVAEHCPRAFVEDVDRQMCGLRLVVRLDMEIEPGEEVAEVGQGVGHVAVQSGLLLGVGWLVRAQSRQLLPPIGGGPPPYEGWLARAAVEFSGSPAKCSIPESHDCDGFPAAPSAAGRGRGVAGGGDGLVRPRR